MAILNFIFFKELSACLVLNRNRKKLYLVHNRQFLYQKKTFRTVANNEDNEDCHDQICKEYSFHAGTNY
jgi:hypothetical protein